MKECIKCHLPSAAFEGVFFFFNSPSFHLLVSRVCEWASLCFQHLQGDAFAFRDPGPESTLVIAIVKHCELLSQSFRFIIAFIRFQNGVLSDTDVAWDFNLCQCGGLSESRTVALALVPGYSASCRSWL